MDTVDILAGEITDHAIEIEHIRHCVEIRAIKSRQDTPPSFTNDIQRLETAANDFFKRLEHIEKLLISLRYDLEEDKKFLSVVRKSSEEIVFGKSFK